MCDVLLFKHRAACSHAPLLTSSVAVQAHSAVQTGDGSALGVSEAGEGGNLGSGSNPGTRSRRLLAQLVSPLAGVCTALMALCDARALG